MEISFFKQSHCWLAATNFAISIEHGNENLISPSERTYLKYSRGRYSSTFSNQTINILIENAKIKVIWQHQVDPNEPK